MVRFPPKKSHDTFCPPFANSQFHPGSGKKKAHKLEKNPLDTGRVSWDTQWDKQDSTGPVSKDFLVFTLENRQTRASPGCPVGFQKLSVFVFACAFLSLLLLC